MTLVTLIDFASRGDERGMLVAVEEATGLPFAVQRVYYMYATRPGVRRGGHAHRDLRQIAIAVAGSCRFRLDDGHEQAEVLLDRPERGLLLEPAVWREMFDFSEGCVLLVLASRPYHEKDYIRDRQEFLRGVERRPSP